MSATNPRPTEASPPRSSSCSPFLDCDCGGRCPVCRAYDRMARVAQEKADAELLERVETEFLAAVFGAALEDHGWKIDRSKKMNHEKFDAHEYALNAGWDFYAIEATAEHGVSEEDERILREIYGDDSDFASEELLRWCRRQVEARL